MTVKELVQILVILDPDYDIYVASPDDNDDYFVDGVSHNETEQTVTIRTAQ